MPKDADVEIPSPILNSPPTTASTETVSGGENSAGCPTACPESEQSQDLQLPVQPHWLSAKRAMQSHAADALFAPPGYLRDCSDLGLLCFFSLFLFFLLSLR